MIRAPSRWTGTALILASAIGMLGASSATPTYRPVLERIERAREALDRAQPTPEKAEGWNAYFDAVQGGFEDLAGAEDEAGRREALDRLSRLAGSLDGDRWAPAVAVRDSLREWIAPRRELSEALRRLEAAVEGLPEEPSERDAWRSFVDGVGSKYREYEAAGTVGDRVEALRKLRGGFDSLRRAQARRSWAPATDVQRALEGLLDRPNVSAVIDVPTLQPFLNQDPVKPEVIAFKGQVSYVTPGPRTGFGLLPYSGGIAFYNGQYSYSTTPIQGFQQQVASDPQGQQAAELYQFSATSYNTNLVNAIAVLTPYGLTVDPQNQPSVTANFGAVPQPGHGPALVRGLASLIGYDRQRVLNELAEQALPRIRQETAQGTRELAAIKAGEEVARQNAQLRPFLPGDGTLRFQELALAELAMASSPSAASIAGILQWPGAGPQVGADLDPPVEHRTPVAGTAINVHVNSALTNLAAGLFESPELADVDNAMISIIPPEGDAPLSEGISVRTNASYADLLEEIGRVRSESDSPEATVLRVTKPADPPSFAVDGEGNLVAVVKDLVLEVPAPENAGSGGLLGFGIEPRVFRFELGRVEIALDIQLNAINGGRGVDVDGQVASVSYGGSETSVIAVGDEEDETRSLNLLNRSGALGVLAGQLQGQQIKTEVSTAPLQGFLVQSISEFDPSGWLRVVLRPDPSAPPPSLASTNGVAR